MTLVNRSMVVGVGDGDFGLVCGLLAFKGRIDLDCLKPAVELAHVAFQTEALVRCAGLPLFIYYLQFQELNRAHLHAGAAACAVLLINPDFNLYNVLFSYFGHNDLHKNEARVSR
jgi:hypothetical protein